MEKFKDQSKRTDINPVDWFNFYGEIEDIFKDSKTHFCKNNNEVATFEAGNETIFKVKKHGIVEVVGDDLYFDYARGINITKFMLLTQAKFNGNYQSAISHVRFYIMKQEIPYIRVGTDYYKVNQKPNRYGGISVQLKAWKKDEIRQDHGKELLDFIYKYDDFDIMPDNLNYSHSENNFYNLYCQFPHKLHPELVTENDIPYSINLMNHIFGDQVELGFKYMKILYEYPKQILPILSLVSNERGTGKTTFLNWIDMIFGDNAVLISPDDLARGFNSIYATKNIVMIDETVIEKSTTVERLKSIATAKMISVSQKYVSEYSIPFYGKVILCTNKENDFMRIDEEEVRFWVRKIHPIKKLNTRIEECLFEEIPRFLKYLTQLDEIDFSRSRMVFTQEEIETDSLDRVKTESKSSLRKEIEILIDDFFTNNTEIKEMEVTSKDIKERWFAHNNQVSMNYIRKVIRDEMKIPTDGVKKYYPFGEGMLKTGMPFIFKSTAQDIEIEENSEEFPF